MKTLQILPALEQGGVERGVVEINRALVLHGWSNVVVSAGGRLTERIEADGGRSIVMDVKSKNPLTVFTRARRLRCILEAEKPDVVCVHSRVPAWLFGLANRKLHLPWISFAHGANSISAYSRVMTKGDLVVTPSLYLSHYLQAAYGTPEERIRVIPRAVDGTKFDVNRLYQAFIKSKRREWGLEGFFVVMGVGRITQLKGYDSLIRAMAQLPKNFKLVLVGEAEAKRKDVEVALHQLTAELGLADCVVFAGHQSRVAECLSLASVIVSSNTRKPEAFGRSMAEALAMGKPVVARAFGGACDVVRPGIDGELVPGDDATDWAQAFARAIQAVSQRKFEGLRESALERFSFDLMVKRSLAVYEEVAALRVKE